MKTFYQLLITHFDVLQVRRFIQVQLREITTLLFGVFRHEIFRRPAAVSAVKQAVMIANPAVHPGLVAALSQLPSRAMSGHRLGPEFLDFFLVHAGEIVPTAVIGRDMFETKPVKFIQIGLGFWCPVIRRRLASSEIAGAARRSGRLIDTGLGDRYVIFDSGHKLSMLNSRAAFNSASVEHRDQMRIMQ